MARIKGIEPHEASWLTRLVYWFVRRKVGQIAGTARLVEPIKITAPPPAALEGARSNGNGAGGRAVGAGPSQVARVDQGGNAHRLPVLN